MFYSKDFIFKQVLYLKLNFTTKSRKSNRRDIECSKMGAADKSLRNWNQICLAFTFNRKFKWAASKLDLENKIWVNLITAIKKQFLFCFLSSQDTVEVMLVSKWVSYWL